MEDVRNIFTPLLDKVANGEREALPVYEQVVEAIKYLTSQKAFLMEQAYEEAGYFPEEWRTSERKSFSFVEIPEWLEKKIELKGIEKKYKAFYEVAGKDMYTIDQDGEVQLLPTVKFSKVITKL